MDIFHVTFPIIYIIDGDVIQSLKIIKRFNYWNENVYLIFSSSQIIFKINNNEESGLIYLYIGEENNFQWDTLCKILCCITRSTVLSLTSAMLLYQGQNYYKVLKHQIKY